MRRQSLNGLWTLRPVGSSEAVPGRVPGCVHLDLHAAGRIPHPFAAGSLERIAWVAEGDWEYERTFAVDPALWDEEHVELVCAGVDTVAEIFLNGERLGETRNMFRTYRWAVRERLRPGPNTVRIRLRSPLAEARSQHAARPLPALWNPGTAALRKVPAHFGWDWGPPLPTIGIWRGVALEGFSGARLAEVRIRQEHRPDRVALHLQVQAQIQTAEDLTLTVTVGDPEGRRIRAERRLAALTTALTLEIPEPLRWWPNGLGPQPLYTVAVALEAGGRLLDRRVEAIGLRTLALERRPDRWGESFAFVVNGVRLFVRGANWVPAALFPDLDRGRRMADLLRSAAAVGMNMLRVWGGGGYEEDRFYALCDRLGLLVWQDFPFACMLYPLDDPAFLEELRAEVRENVRRLRHHPSLALWCGNNEIEMLWPLWRWQWRGRGKDLACLAEAHERFFYHLLPEWLQEEDPDRPYWPGSPSSGRFLEAVGDDRRGDVHLWRVWHGLAPTTHYRKRIPRFVSEFGVQSLPALETLQAFARPGEPASVDQALRERQRSPGGNMRLGYYLAERFRTPARREDWIYLTQIVQAEAVRAAVEHWRRHRDRCGGALFWQLNDLWPAVSWSSIDVTGRWKALHYAARRFFDPVLLSVAVEGPRVALFLINDTREAWTGSIHWSLETFTGEVLAEGHLPAEAPPLSVQTVGRFSFAPHLRRHRRALAFIAERWRGERLESRQVALFAPEKDLPLPDPGLHVTATVCGEVLEAEVRAQALARFVALDLPGVDVRFSDNFFDLPAGRAVRVHGRLPPGWAAPAPQALRVRSLADVRPAGPRWLDRARRLALRLSPGGLAAALAMRLLESRVRSEARW